MRQAQPGLGVFFGCLFVWGLVVGFFSFFLKKDLPITLLTKQFKSTFATD